MNKNEVLETWAPTGGEWSLWVRPVLFAQMDDRKLSGARDMAGSEMQAISTPEFASDAAVIVDLPGAESVTTGLALALKGYRPVPLYNGCTGRNEVVDQSAIMEKLAGGARILAVQWLKDAPPVFLLDSLRTLPKRVKPRDFDNRWRVFAQDMPGPEVLKARGLRRVIVVQSGSLAPARDLAGVLAGWQAAGIGIEVCDIKKSLQPTAIVVKPPWWMRTPWKRLMQMFGLDRGPRQGFGYIVPEPTHG